MSAGHGSDHRERVATHQARRGELGAAVDLLIRQHHAQALRVGDELGGLGRGQRAASVQDRNEGLPHAQGFGHVLLCHIEQSADGAESVHESGLGDGWGRGFGLACGLMLAPERGLHAVSDARRQVFRPLVHRLVCAPDGTGGGADGTAELVDGVLLLHAAIEPRLTTQGQQGGAMISTMAEYSERLAEAMQAAGYDKTRLHRELGISYQAVKKAVEGGKFGTENHLKAAKLLGVSPDWLADGKGARAPSSSPQSGGGVAHGMSHTLPIVTPKETTREKVMEEGVPNRAFALEVWDDAAAPRATRGQVGCFVPGVAAQAGEVILLRSPDGALYLRIFEPGIGGAWRGVSQAIGHGSLGSAEGCEVLAVLAWATRRELFGAMGSGE